jgi:hypothetical protein
MLYASAGPAMASLSIVFYLVVDLGLGQLAPLLIVNLKLDHTSSVDAPL